MHHIQTIEDVWAFLDSIPMFSSSGPKAMNLGLESIRGFLNHIGNPEKNFRSIHIAGTNGKGTTARMLETVYQSVGLKTGVFTSPHLLKYNERIRLNAQNISDEVLLSFFKQYATVLDEYKLTYFEISTALAFWVFSLEKVDLAIIEAGLGGRLDSTNVILPEVSIITSIGLDHQSILGETKEEIAAEKGGIIKQGIPVVVGNVEIEPCNVIESIAKEKGASFFKVDQISASQRVTLRLMEEVNYWNASVTLKVAQLLGKLYPVPERKAIEALEKLEGIPARFEKLAINLNWYFSGAHNAQAIQSTMDAIGKIQAPSKRVVVLSVLKDKIDNDILSAFQGFDQVYYFQQEGERAATLDDIAPFLDAKSISEKNVLQILNEFKSEVVIFTGSFYFYPVVTRWITKVNNEPPAQFILT